MNESGTTPPDWTQWLHDAGSQGANILRGLAATMSAAGEGRDATPIFVEAWQEALNAEATDAEAAAERFTESVHTALRRMREDTRAGAAALEGALRGMRGGTGDRQDDWLSAAYRAAREEQGRGTDTGALESAFRHYMEALTAYQGELSRAVEAGLASFQEALLERRRARSEPLGLTDIHALWIESAEPAYEEILNSKAYGHAFARLHNAALELGSTVQSCARPWLEALGLPSRAELEAMHRQMGELRRERNRSRRLESEVTILRQEVEALRAELHSTSQRGAGTGGTRDRH